MASHWVAVEQAREQTIGTLCAAGMMPGPAGIVATALVDADVRGHRSHGLQLLSVYIERIKRGGILPNAVPRWEGQGTGCVRVLDANGAPGQVAATLAAEEVVQLARKFGVAAVAVRNNNHIGMLAAYRHPFAAEGCLGLIMNLAGQSVAPPGGSLPTLGNDAVCFIAPRGDADPLIVDFATGAVACGKIREAALLGNSVPSGWLLTPSGESTTDPRQLDLGGSVPVFGGHKGLAVTIIVELLAGALAGGVLSGDVKRQRLNPDQAMGCSQLFIAFDPDAFHVGDMEPFVERLAAQVAESYRGVIPDVYFPEQAERSAAMRSRAKGIEVHDDVWRLLEGSSVAVGA